MGEIVCAIGVKIHLIEVIVCTDYFVPLSFENHNVIHVDVIKGVLG
jgi:hypothetical protein